MCTTFLHRSYHSVRPGELDVAEFSTFRHTFFSFFFLLGEEGYCSGWGSGATQSACPSLCCWIMKRCSSFFLNLKNISSLSTRKRISPFLTSILALADLRKGRPSMRSTPRLPSISITTKSARTKESHTHTKTCSAIPLGYRMVESTSCMSIVVGERTGYSSASYIT